MQSQVVSLLYTPLVHQARDPWFYTEVKVPDTLDGRFEMICLHMACLLYRFKRIPASSPHFRKARQVGQGLYDLMFADFDACLREMGVGDLGVGKRVKQMVQAFHGRLHAYAHGIEGQENLQDALRRNVYGTTAVSEKTLEILAHYMVQLNHRLQAAADEAVVSGTFAWAAPRDLVQVSAA